MSMHDLVFGEGWKPASSVELADMEALAGVLLGPQPTTYSKTFGVRVPEGAQAMVRVNWEDDGSHSTQIASTETVFEFFPNGEEGLASFVCRFNHVDEMVDLYFPEEDGFAAVGQLQEVSAYTDDEQMHGVLEYFRLFFGEQYSSCVEYLAIQHGGLDGSTKHIAARMRELVETRSNAVAFMQGYESPDPSDGQRILELRRRGVNSGGSNISMPEIVPDLEIELTDRAKDQGWLYLRYPGGDHRLNFYVPTHETDERTGLEQEEAFVDETEVESFLDTEAEVDEFWEMSSIPSATDVEMLTKVLERFVIMEQEQTTQD